MYSNGNGNGSNSGYRSYASIGGYRVRSSYLYIGVAIVAIIAIYLVMRFLSTSLMMHFSMYAGGLLLIANIRELIGQQFANRNNTALLNVMIGGALVFAYLSQFFGSLLWIPALLLAALATPLTVRRLSVYDSYVQIAGTAVSGIRRTMGR